MNKKDRKVIEALPVRFEQLDLEAKPKSIEDRLDNFKRVVVKSFGPAIKRIQMGLTERFEEYLSWDQKRIANLDVFTRGYFEEWKAATAKQRSELTLKWAKEEVDPDITKVVSKLLLLDDPKIEYYNVANRELKLTGTIFGSKVDLIQNEIEKTNEQGTTFLQFPAHIYLDGKKTAEKAYHYWFQENSADTFATIGTILSDLAAKNKYPIGTILYTTGKYKPSDAKKGVWPFVAHIVTAVDGKSITVQPLKIEVETFLDRFSDQNRFSAIYMVTNEPAGDVEIWDVKSTPTSSKVIGRPKTKRLDEGFYIDTYLKAWRGFKPTIKPMFTPDDFKPKNWTLEHTIDDGKGGTDVYDIGNGYHIKVESRKNEKGDILVYKMGEDLIDISEADEFFHTLEVQPGKVMNSFYTDNVAKQLSEIFTNHWTDMLTADPFLVLNKPRTYLKKFIEKTESPNTKEIIMKSIQRSKQKAAREIRNQIDRMISNGEDLKDDLFSRDAKYMNQNAQTISDQMTLLETLQVIKEEIEDRDVDPIEAISFEISSLTENLRLDELIKSLRQAKKISPDAYLRNRFLKTLYKETQENTSILYTIDTLKFILEQAEK